MYTTLCPIWVRVCTGFICLSIVFFFFQAEDGIRDYKVTGVQTCALPISDGGMAIPGALVGNGKEQLQAIAYEGTGYGHPAIGTVSGIEGVDLDDVRAFVEIGRASCRGRV